MPVTKISLHTNTQMNTKYPNFNAQQAKPVIGNKKSYSGIALTGLTIALLGGIAYFKRESLGIGKLFKTLTQNQLKKVEIRISELKDKYRPEAHRVLKENTHNNMVNLSAIEPAAAMRSASKTEENKFHQAASWIEEAYKDAYSKAELKDGNNILNYIYRRIGSENGTLAQMYAQMPEKEAYVRVKQFASESIQKDTHSGMTTEDFVNGLVNKLIPKAKGELANPKA